MKTLNELIIESAADGVIAVDINGCVTMINPAAEEITGYLERICTANITVMFLRGAVSPARFSIP